MAILQVASASLLGSTRLVTDSSGTAQATYSFDAYGNLTANTGTALRFAGQYQDSESRLYYLRARYYDSSTGQFISRDPAASTTREPYAYVNDNPLNGIDPSGLDWWHQALSWAIGQAAGVVGGWHDYLIQTQSDLEAGVFNGDWGCGARGVGRSFVVASLFVGVAGLTGGGISLLAPESALSAASRAAFKAADNARDFSVPLKHLFGSAGRWAKFGEGGRCECSD